MANSRIKGITVEINGETTGLDKALQDVNKSIRSTQSELNDVNRLLKFDPSNVELLSQKQTALQSAISQTSEKLETLKRAAEQAQDKLANGEMGQDQYDRLQREIIATEQRLQSFQSQAEETENALQNAGTEEATEDVRELGEETEEAGKKSKDAGDDMVGLGDKINDLAKNAIDGAKEKLKEFSQQFLDTQDTFAKLQAATGATGDAFDELKDTVQGVYADNFGESMDDAANAVQTVNQSIKGLDSSQLQSATEDAMMLEDVFGMDMSESVRGVNALMSQFGITSEQAFDLISSGAQNGLNYSDELGDNLSEYSGKFAEAGYSANEYFQLLQNGADGGFYNLDKVNDAINEVTTRLGDGTIKESIFTIDDETGEIAGTTGTWSDATAEVFKKWEEGGASQKDVIEQIVKDINSATSEEEMMNLASTAFGSIAEDSGTKAIRSLTSVGNAYSDVKGKADEINNVAYDTPQAQLEALKRTIETDVITPIGESLMPLMQQTIDFITENAPSIQEKVQSITTWISETLIPKCQEVFDWVQEHLPQIEATIVGFITLIAAYSIGTKIAALVDVIIKIVSVVKAGIPVFTALNAVMGLNPVVIIIAAIAALVAAFVVLWNKCDAFREFWINLWQQIQEWFQAWCDGVKEIWDTLKDTATNVWNGIKDGIINVVTTIKDTVTGIWNGIKDTTVGIWNGIKDGVSGAISKVYNTIHDGLENAWDYIKSIPQQALQWGKDIIQGIIDGINSAIDWLVDSVKNIGQTIKDFIGFSVPEEGPLSDFDTYMPDMMKGLATGIERNKWRVVKAMNGLASDMSAGTIALTSAGGTATAGTVINNIDNSKTVNQTNNSPKALSRLEIYRQTNLAVNRL